MNQLTGTIPENLGELTNLVYLLVFFITNLIIKIYEILTIILNILINNIFIYEYLFIFHRDLSENNLHGEIPKSFGTLTNLKVLYV